MENTTTTPIPNRTGRPRASEPSARISLVMPYSLRRAVEAAADARNQPLNTFIGDLLREATREGAPATPQT
jgi:hypothetical protein